MTVQVSEGLIYEGTYRALHSKPLEDYLAQLDKRPQFGFFATNNWRGYIGEWEIVEGKLYLNRLQQMGSHKSPDGLLLPTFEPNRVSVSDIFPDDNGPVSAEWYTGKLRCPEGEVIECYVGEFGVLHERYLVFDVVGGVVKKIELQPGRRERDPKAFADVNCASCDFEDRLLIEEWFKVPKRAWPVWCRDCQTLSVQDHDKKPMCCAACGSSRVRGASNEGWIAALRVLWGEKPAMDKSRLNPKGYKLGNIYVDQSIYLCPKCGEHALRFKYAFIESEIGSPQQIT